MSSPIQKVLCFVFVSLFLAQVSHGQVTNEAIARATAAMQAAVPRAHADPERPIFHVMSPAQWVNDPNGPIFYKGYYHLFYQLHPFSDESGPKYWGHVRSRDLVKWEHLPIALWPSTELGESEVWSGCCTINGEGKPMAFYTSIAPGKSAQTHAEQWAAIGDDKLITWRKSPANPVLSETLHGDKKIYEWRDPFIFQDKKRTFLVTGGNLNQTKGGEAVVNIYEAQNAALTQWKYRGVLFQLPDPGSRTAECPNFFKLGDKWVLFVSPYGKVQYFVGDFDANTCRFQAQTRGLLDYGPNFYAPNTMQLPDGRRIVWGWVNGFSSGHGWNGCLSLPRSLSLSRDGQLRQDPAPQLKKLRGREELSTESFTFAGKSWTLPETNTLEIQADVDLAGAESAILELADSNETRSLPMKFTRSEFAIAGVHVPLSLGKEGRLNLRIFIDRSVMEVFANGSMCVTKKITPLNPNSKWEFQVRGDAANAARIRAWPMKAIW